MSRNILTLSKWMPIEIKAYDNLFIDFKELLTISSSLINRIGLSLHNFKLKKCTKAYYSVSSDYEQQLQDIEDISTTMEAISERFDAIFRSLCEEKPPIIISSKMKLTKSLLWQIKLKISYFIHEFITEIAYLFIYYGERILILTLRISTAYNSLLAMDGKYILGKTMSVCNNTCPYLMFPLRKISITRLLQILALNRAEICCHKLIDCLLETYKVYDNTEDDTNSDNSSLEIYIALTKHMSPRRADVLEKAAQINNVDDLEDSGSFVNLEEMIAYEEKNVVDLLTAALNHAPMMLGNDSVKKEKNSEITKISPKARAKVLEYYEEILWCEVGNYLEHIILWWAACPLSARPPHSSQHLREWINHFVPTAEVPAVVLSALSSLAEALGVHVTSTSWDQHFRLALVASKTTCNPDTGQLFCNVLQDLVLLSNQCEATPDWIVGAPLDELPLVEQIPVLHRLDHSVHTARLWAINESKKIANTWNVEAFFAVTHSDIVNCVAQLNNLRLSDHSNEIEKGGLGVHVEVCALMRAKLASEVNTNIGKLKQASSECVEGLAAVCRTISLANLQMIFPGGSYWKQSSSDPPSAPSNYVGKYLDQILLPVLATTSDHVICNMILTLMCESWLDHIYTNKIKFSQSGAYQLLMDFDYITNWLDNCGKLTPAMRKKLLKNEILRRCEGVGRLLLRNPGERIKMVDRHKRRVSTTRIDVASSPGKTELMPAEMYVPNQEQWLELRAVKRRSLFNRRLCCGGGI